MSTPAGGTAPAPDIEKVTQALDAKVKSATDPILEQNESLKKQVAQLSKDFVEFKSRVTVGEPSFCPEGIRLYSKIKSFAGSEHEQKEKCFKWGSWVLASLFGNKKYADKCKEMGIEIVSKDHSEGVNTKGGFLVPNVLENFLIDLREKYGVFRSHARVLPMTRDTHNINRRVSGLTAYWPGEAGAITSSDKAWDQVTLTAKKLAALSKVSSELLEDAMISVMDDLAAEIVYAFELKKDQCGFIGDGTSTYNGIVGVSQSIKDKWTSATTTSAGCVVAAGNTFAEVTHANLVSVAGRLPQYAANAPGVAWYCSRLVWAEVFGRLSTNVTAGHANTKSDMATGLPMSYLGYPFVITQVMPTTDNNEQIIAFFGDLRSAATLGDRRETVISISNDRYFENDQVGIKGTERFDINVHDVGDGTTAGPVIGLRALNS